ncbi:FecCD family ABC transporter permease [Calditerrivibrio nitroreducens]
MNKDHFVAKIFIIFFLTFCIISLQLFYDTFPLVNDINTTIIAEIRLPRAILGLLAGGGLALCGTVLQGVFRNNLVEPYTLGISGGSAVGVALGLMVNFQTFLGFSSLIIAGFLGALFSLFILYIVAIRNHKIDTKNLLLIGVMISFISSSLLMLILSISKVENLHGIVFWIMGSLGNAENNINFILFFIVSSGFVIFYLLANDLNAMQFGYEKSFTLGVNIDVVIKITIITASFITASIVSVTGMVGFIGLVVPHLMRKLFYKDFRILLPTSFLGGGFFLTASDFLASKIIYPNELPVGVITGIVGGIFFIYIFKKERIR